MSNNWTYVTVAYTAVWIAIGSYWLYVHRALKRARARYAHAGAKREGTTQ